MEEKDFFDSPQAEMDQAADTFLNSQFIVGNREASYFLLHRSLPGDHAPPPVIPFLDQVPCDSQTMDFRRTSKEPGCSCSTKHASYRTCGALLSQQPWVAPHACCHVQRDPERIKWSEQAFTATPPSLLPVDPLLLSLHLADGHGSHHLYHGV